MMLLFHPHWDKLKHVWYFLWAKLALLYQWFKVWLPFIFHMLIFQANPFWIHLVYFVILSSIGFLSVKALKPRTAPRFIPKDLDIFFTVVSATTLSSLSTVEMEVFSNMQLGFLTIMMLFGGEVFISVIGLFLTRVKMKQQERKVECNKTDQSHTRGFDDKTSLSGSRDLEMASEAKSREEEFQGLKSKSIGSLACLVSCYLLVVHLTGSSLILIYLRLTPSARSTLKTKDLRLETFSIFTTVSSFANCGFLPTNENMMVFKKHSTLLLITIPQILMGNTLYPACLHVIISFLESTTGKPKFRYIQANSRELGYGHLFSRAHCIYLTVTCLVLVLLQLTVFCSLEWNSKAIGSGLNAYQKLVASLFQVVNSRHAGESVFDLSAVSAAVLVLFALMMYLPPYTTFLPLEEAQKMSRISEQGDKKKRKRDFLGQILFSQQTYLIIIIILVCIIEREEMKRDPLNFNVLSITVEVISAHGNVGFSVGYDCRRRIQLDAECKNTYYGLVGRWSNGGKLVMILVMLFGRLRKFNTRGGRAWVQL